MYLEDRVYENGELHVNGVHYFVYEANLDKKKAILEVINRISSDFNGRIIMEDQVRLEEHCISELIDLYRIKPG
jgi:hypothetical protein